MTDEIIQEIRKARHDISRECGHDLHKLAAYYRAYQEELKRSGRYGFFNAKPKQCTESCARQAEVR